MTRRIVMLNPSAQVTGPLVAGNAIACTLKGEAAITLVIPDSPAFLAQQFTGFSAIETIPLVNLSRRASDMRRFLPTLLRGAWRLRAIMRKHKADCLILNDVYLLHGFVLRLLGYRGQIVTYISCHPQHMLGKMWRFFLWQARLASNQLVTVSQSVRLSLPQPEAVKVIGNIFIGSGRMQPQAQPIIICIGNYIEGKGQEVTLAAFLRIASQFPEASLHFYGATMGLEKNELYLQKIKNTAAASEATNRIHFHGFAEDTSAIVQQAYMAVNASVSESFSMTVLEAQGAGVPVIATRSGGPQEIIIEGQTGFLVPVGDDVDFAQRMQQLLSDAALAERMGQAAAAHIAQHFSPAAIKPLLMELLVKHA